MDVDNYFKPHVCLLVNYRASFTLSVCVVQCGAVVNVSVVLVFVCGWRHLGGHPLSDGHQTGVVQRQHSMEGMDLHMLRSNGGCKYVQAIATSIV